MQDADRRRAPALPYRIGHGFDLHRLEEGPYKLILGGLEIPHDRGCVAHSDGKHPQHICIAPSELSIQVERECEHLHSPLALS